MDMPANAKTQTISGKKYVFIDTPYWNAEKHRGEHKRRYIWENSRGPVCSEREVSAITGKVRDNKAWADSRHRMQSGRSFA